MIVSDWSGGRMMSSGNSDDQRLVCRKCLMIMDWSGGRMKGLVNVKNVDQ